MKKLLVLIIVFLSIAIYAIEVPGGEVNGIWTTDNSPYIILGDITVSSQTLLEIEAGVEVIFNDFYSLTVNGGLQANGTVSDSITFDYTEGGSGWQGIRFIDTNNDPESSVLSHCRILHGTAIGADELAYGGGVYCNNSSNVLIDGCSFVNNYASWDGGAVCLKNGSDITITNSMFTENDCGFYGSCIIAYGSSPVISGCCFINNESNVFAAGVSAWDDSDIELTNCRFLDNYAGACTGFYGVSSTVRMANVLFVNNDTEFGSGGAIGLTSCQTELSNVTIVDNESALSGGAVWVNEGHLDLYNSILWGNLPNELAPLGAGTITASNCCIMGGYAGEAIIEDDPEFVDYEEYDLHLEETSLCIDAGDASLVTFTLPEYDLDGMARIMDGNGDGTDEIDLGIYEFEFIMTYEPPAHLNIDASTGFVSWESPSQEGLTGFRIFLDEVMLAEIAEVEYQLTDLEAGIEYTVGLLAVYETGESPIVEALFTYEPTDNNDSDISAINLIRNYPNPFNPETTISFSLSSECKKADIDIYNQKGQKIRTLTSESRSGIYHSAVWNGKDSQGNDVSSGIYLYKISAGIYSSVNQMVLIK